MFQAHQQDSTLTFTNCKLSVVDISKSVEGAVKADITVICPGEPTSIVVMSDEQ